MSVICPATSVLPHSPAELRHRQHHDVIHSLAEVLVKRSYSGTELLQQISQLPTRIALVDVRVPAVDVGKSDFQANAGFDELSYLQERIAKRIPWILRAIFRFVLRRIGRLQIINCLESLSTHVSQRVSGLTCVDRFKTALQFC